MRFVAVASILAALVAAGITRAQTVQAQTAPVVVSVAVTTAAVRTTAFTRSDILLLWNRNERLTPIGHAVKACIKAGMGGIRGGGLMSCDLTIALPQGKLTASGIVHNLARYTLVITGGTGRYVDARGPLFIRRVADGVRRLTFTL